MSHDGDAFANKNPQLSRRAFLRLGGGALACATVLGAPALLESDVVPVIELADSNIAVLFDGHFEPGSKLSNVDVLVEMNYDAFGDPMAAPAARGDLRHLSALASECGAHVVSANQCGAADAVVFAGNSTVTAPNGSLMHAAPIDEEDLFVFDTAPGAVHEVQQRPAVELDIREIVWRAIVVATREERLFRCHHRAVRWHRLFRRGRDRGRRAWRGPRAWRRDARPLFE